MTIQFFIPFCVEPKQGDRSRIVGSGKKQFVHHYQPSKVRKNAEALILLAAQHRPNQPLEGPLYLGLDFYSPWRASESKKNRAAGAAFRDTKPDYDNMAKQVGDVLQAAGFFRNDSQLADVHLRKFWAGFGGVDIIIGPAVLAVRPAIIEVVATRTPVSLEMEAS